MSTKRKSAAPPPSSKSMKTLPPLHDSQLALAKRAVQLSATHEAIIFTPPPGFGKTRTVGKYMQDVPGYDLVLWVAKTPKLARDQAVEVGAIYDVPLTTAHIKGLAKNLSKRSEGDPPIAVTMTQSFFKTLLKDQKFVSGFTGPLGSPKIHLVLDEAHGLYVRPSAATTAMGWLHKFYPMRITGVTATPQLESDGCKKRALTLYGAEATLVDYTAAERKQFKTDLMTHRPSSKPKWQPVALLTPDANEYDGWLKDLGTIVTGNTAKATKDVGIDAWVARGNITATVLADQVHGSAGDGGLLFKNQLVDGVPWQRKQPDGSLAEVKRPEVAIIVHKTPAGNKQHLLKLQELAGTEGVRPFVVHDLRTKDLASYKAALASFTADAKTTNKTVLGFVDKAQIEGTNDYAKNVSTIVAVGDWTDAELDQLGGRLGRPCEVQAGDLVPKGHSLIHFASEWEKQVKEIGLVRHSTRAVAMPQELKKKVEALKDAMIEDKVKKLIDGEARIFGKDGHRLASAYLKSLQGKPAFEETYKAAIKQWFTMNFDDDDDEVDTASDDGK